MTRDPQATQPHQVHREKLVTQMPPNPQEAALAQPPLQPKAEQPPPTKGKGTGKDSPPPSGKGKGKGEEQGKKGGKKGSKGGGKNSSTSKAKGKGNHK